LLSIVAGEPNKLGNYEWHGCPINWATTGIVVARFIGHVVVVVARFIGHTKEA